MNDAEKASLCIIVGRGINHTMRISNEVLRNHLYRSDKIWDVDVNRLHLLKIAMPTIEKYCGEEIGENGMDILKTRVNVMLRELETYAK